MRLILFLLLVEGMSGAPQRIVSTGPSITEILFALGLGPKVVGATDYCNYPAEARKIRRVGSWMTTNMEAVLEVRPDLVIVQKTAIHDDSRYRALQIPTLVVTLESVQGILQTIEEIGARTGVQAQAAKLNTEIRAELDKVRKRVAGRTPPRAMFVVGRTPGSLEGIIATGSRSYLTEVIEIAGGKNIFSDAPVAYPKVVHEEILSRDPQVVIDMGEHADAGSIAESQKRREVALYGRYPGLSAVRSKRIHIVSSDLFVHPGPRVVDLARELMRLFHPELAP